VYTRTQSKSAWVGAVSSPTAPAQLADDEAQIVSSRFCGSFISEIWSLHSCLTSPSTKKRTADGVHSMAYTWKSAAASNPRFANCGNWVGVTDTVAKERAVGDLWRLGHSFRAARSVSHALTRRSLGFVNDCPEISRDEIARRSNASPGEISRHFHRDMGLPLSAYRTRVRLLRFIQLVDAGNTFLHAALAAGFGSYSQCHRVFHATLACAPSTFFASPIRQLIEEAFAPFAP
jgi:AraC-like DNA-binding protein